METKTCKKCGEVKTLDEFSRDRSRSDGRRNSCKTCDSAYKRTPESRLSNAQYQRSERGKQSVRKYRATTKGKASTARHIARRQASGALRDYAREYARTPKAQARIQRYIAKPEVRKRRREHSSQWAIEHPEKGRANSQRRFARKRQLPYTLTHDEWQRALDYFDHRCAYCGSSGKLVQEHFVPLVSDGPYTRDNIVPACYSCNGRKGAKSAETWCLPEIFEKITHYFDSLSLVTSD